MLILSVGKQVFTPVFFASSALKSPAFKSAAPQGDSFKLNEEYVDPACPLSREDIIRIAFDKKIKPIGEGVTSDVKKTGNVVVKIPKDNECQSVSTREFLALNYLNKNGLNVAPRALALVKSDNGKFLLAMDYIKGKDAWDNKLTPDNITDLFGKFADMDAKSIVSADLTLNNMFSHDNGETDLIDFGNVYLTLNDGSIIQSGEEKDYKKFLTNGEIARKTSKPASERLLATFEMPKHTNPTFMLAEGTDNPHMTTCSNLSNFEHRGLYKYLMTMDGKDSLEFFKTYLQKKGEHYHSKMAEYLKILDPGSLSWEAQERFNKAMAYEENMAGMLKNPSDEVIKTELYKIQLRFCLAAHEDDIMTKICGFKYKSWQKTGTTYDNLREAAQKNMDKTSGFEREYFKNMYEIFYAPTREFMPEMVRNEIGDSEDIVKKLFPQSVK